MQKGNIGVTSKDIFPLIKKFMYNDQDIFIREIVSNAIDATQKLITLINSNEYSANKDELKVTVTLDANEKTITVSDNGIGMTLEEIDKYINQIAFSGANEFLEKYSDANIIGHFGLGFYSSFMVSDKVELITKSYKSDKAYKWSCTGTIDYEITEIEKNSVGTDVVMYISEEHSEYINPNKIKELLIKYAKYLPVEVNFIYKAEQYTDSSTNEIVIPEDKTEKITVENALWTRKPSELTDDDYIQFYHETFPGKPDPLFWIHINIDMPFTFTGILYFPSFDKTRPIFEHKNISLYCNRVFVTDNVEGILPEYLSLLHGVIDSPDIPLNVSRSFLQSDSNVKKISSHITNKVMSSLKTLMDDDRKKYEEKWDTIKLFINLGVVTLPEVYQKAKDILLLTDIDNKKYTFDEYFEKVKENQTDKHGRIIYLYTYDTHTQVTYIENLVNMGYNILLLNEQYSAFIVQAYEVEGRDKNIEWRRIDSNTPDKLIEKDVKERKQLADNVKNMIVALFDATERKFEDLNHEFIVDAMGPDALPVTIVADEWFRRMKEMSMLNNNGMFLGQSASIKFMINSDAKVIKKIIKNAEKSIGAQITEINNKIAELNSKIAEASEDDKKNIQADIDVQLDNKKSIIKLFVNEDHHVNELIDIALLEYGLLTGEDLARFVRRSIKLIEK